jgi:hypothetical protein
MEDEMRRVSREHSCVARNATVSVRAAAAMLPTDGDIILRSRLIGIMREIAKQSRTALDALEAADRFTEAADACRDSEAAE